MEFSFPSFPIYIDNMNMLQEFHDITRIFIKDKIGINIPTENLLVSMVVINDFFT